MIRRGAGPAPPVLLELDDWDGSLPVGLLRSVVSAEDRRRRFLDFARIVSGDPAAELRHADGRAPVLEAAGPGLRVSSASRDGVAAFAASRGPVGIDIERIGTSDEMASGVLHPDEQARLAELTPSGRPRLFATVWACKEAYGKALGAGLFHDPASFRVEIGPDGATVRDGDVATRVRTSEHLVAGETFVVALVILPRPSPRNGA